MAEEQRPSEEKEPPKQDPLGFDFWTRHVVRILGVVIGIAFSGLVGFGSASRFAQHEDARLALTALTAIHREVRANVAAIAAARAALEAGDSIRVELKTDYLDAAAGKPFMVCVDPAVLADVEKLFAHPLPLMIENFSRGTPDPRERRRAIDHFGAIEERSRAVSKALDAQEAALRETLLRLRGER